MRSRRLLELSSVVVVLVAGSALADAPRDQYAPFDRDEPFIVDQHTGLAWARRAETKRPHAAARAACSSLTYLSAPMRLPTAKELLTLVDEEPHGEYESGRVVQKMFDRSAFAGLPVEFAYWTDSLVTGRANEAWTVSFATGELRAESTFDDRQVLCVR